MSPYPYASAVKKICDGSKVAQISNFRIQLMSIGRLEDIERTILRKAEYRFSASTATGDSIRASQAKSEVQSAQDKLKRFRSQSASIDSKLREILKSCSLPSNRILEQPKVTKLLTCTQEVIGYLRGLASKYKDLQALQELNYKNLLKYRDRYQIAIANGRFSEASSAQVLMANLVSDNQENLVLSQLIKEQFIAINSTCKNSGVALPKEFVSPQKTESESTFGDSPFECQDANCMFKSWNIANVGILGVNGQPSRVEKSSKANFRTYCSFRGNGSIGVTNPRIFMSFTSNESWNRSYPYSSPKEDAFYMPNGINGISTQGLETLDLGKVNNYFWSDALKKAESKNLYGKSILKVTEHICNTSIPWQGNVRKQYGENIKGVGFFYTAQLSNSQTLLIYLGGYHADRSDDPILNVEETKVENNQLQIKGTLVSLSRRQGLYNHVLPTDWPSNGYPTSVTFAPINKVKFERFDDDTLVCYAVDSGNKNCTDKLDNSSNVLTTLDVSTLSAGGHSIVITAESPDGRVFAKTTRSFNISK